MVKICEGLLKKRLKSLPISNHEESDTRLVFHAEMTNEAAVIVAKDSKAFLLLIYALCQLELFLPPVYMKIDSNQVINIRIIYNHLESEI